MNKADLLLLKNGYDIEGNKIRKKNHSVSGRSQKDKAHRKLSQDVIKNSKDLIEKRKSASMSNGEKIICDYLIREGIRFHREFYIQGLFTPETKKPLFFDFFIPSFELAIEIDGIQHYKQGAQTAETFEALKKRDKLKDKFCKKRGITLLRLPYWELNRAEYLVCEVCDKIANKLLGNVNK